MTFGFSAARKRAHTPEGFSTRALQCKLGPVDVHRCYHAVCRPVVLDRPSKLARYATFEQFAAKSGCTIGSNYLGPPRSSQVIQMVSPLVVLDTSSVPVGTDNEPYFMELVASS